MTAKTPRGHALGEELAHWAPYALVTLITAAAAYFQVFTTFYVVDDEGYLLLSLHQFAAGGHLYDDVFSQYGPFLYESYGAFFKLTGLPFSTDVGHVITWVLWIVTALGYGLLTERLTKNRWLGLLAQLSAFAVLVLSAREPMHPTGPTTLLVLLILAVAITLGAQKKAAIGIGALIAAVALTKVNVGALAGAGIVVAAALTLAGSHVRRWQAIALAVVVLAPLALLSSNLDVGYYREFAFLAVVWLGTAAARAIQAQAPERDGRALSAGPFIAWLAAGVAAAALVICAVILALGTSFSGLVDGVLLDPMRHPAEITGSPQILGLSLWLSAAMLVVVVAWPRLTQRLAEWLPALTGFVTENSLALRGGLRLAVAIIIVLCAVRVQWIGDPNIAVALPPLLAWLAVVAPRELEESSAQRFVRAAIVFVAIFEILQAYPPPGAQLLAGMLTFVLVAAVVAADGLALLAIWQKTAESDDRRLATLAITLTAVVLACHLLVFEVAKPGKKALTAYRDNPSLALPGAGLVHLPRAQTEGLEATVRAVKAQNCHTLLTVPGMNSFADWTGVPPPTGENLTHWFEVLDNQRQQRVVDAIRGKPGLCIVRNDGLVSFWATVSKKGQIPDRPLWRYLQALPVTDVSKASGGTFGEYRVQVPAATRRPAG